jgi:hypothetical protein
MAEMAFKKVALKILLLRVCDKSTHFGLRLLCIAHSVHIRRGQRSRISSDRALAI